MHYFLSETVKERARLGDRRIQEDNIITDVKKT
jgi:hypothetical protein